MSIKSGCFLLFSLALAVLTLYRIYLVTLDPTNIINHIIASTTILSMLISLSTHHIIDSVENKK